MVEIEASYMAHKMNSQDKTVTAIIPAHNEEMRIGTVIKVLKSLPVISKVVVVDDGSSDETSRAAKDAGADVLRLEKNRGKAAAMDEGVRKTTGEIILFLDADLLNLKENHVLDLLEPVLKGEVQMTMGVFRNGRFRTDIAHRISPGLSGQRAMLRGVWNSLDNKCSMEEIGYGIEEELQGLVKDGKVTLKTVILEGVSQYTKEEKMGPQKGFKLRMKMYRDIINVWARPFKS
jgi:polyisoprenyl-phosphate glycosyltransferase